MQLRCIPNTCGETEAEEVCLLLDDGGLFETLVRSYMLCLLKFQILFFFFFFS
jgi:hypothetical protein